MEKFLEIMGKFSLEILQNTSLLQRFFFPFEEKLGRRAVFCKILKDNSSTNFKNFFVVINTRNVYSRVRTNIEGH